MNVDPKSSKNYDQAIEKTKRMNQGARHSVGNKRLTERQICELTGKSPGYVYNCLQVTTADKFVARMMRKK